MNFQGNQRKRMKTSAPSSPPPSDDSDSDWEPAAERKPAKKRQAASRAAKGRGVGKFSKFWIALQTPNELNYYET